jgi:hypothetical protein
MDLLKIISCPVDFSVFCILVTEHNSINSVLEVLQVSMKLLKLNEKRSVLVLFYLLEKSVAYIRF